MNKLWVYMLSGFMILIYITSIIGVGTHSCRRSAEQVFVLLAGEACPYGHAESAPHCVQEEKSCCCAKYSHHHNNEDQNCCSVTYKTLQIDQEVPALKSLLKNFTEQLTFLFIPIITKNLLEPLIFSWCNSGSPPFIFNTVPKIYRFSQLRL